MWSNDWSCLCGFIMTLPVWYNIALIHNREWRKHAKRKWGQCCSFHFIIWIWCTLFLAATKQLYKWYFPSVRLSVCPSVRLSVRLSVTPFWLCSHRRIIMKLSEVITNDQRKVHAKGQGQRSKVKVTEVTTQLNRFRTITPVWIHIWW